MLVWSQSPKWESRPTGKRGSLPSAHVSACSHILLSSWARLHALILGPAPRSHPGPGSTLSSWARLHALILGPAPRSHPGPGSTLSSLGPAPRSHPGPGSTLSSLGLAPRVVAIVWMTVSIHSARMIHEAVTTELMSTWNCPSFRRLCNTVAMYIVLCSLWSPLCYSIHFLLLWVPATTT